MRESREAALWVAVIGRAVEDLETHDVRDRARAVAWFFAPQEEPSFMAVCTLAGADPSWIRASVKRRIEEVEARAEETLRKRAAAVASAAKARKAKAAKKTAANEQARRVA